MGQVELEVRPGPGARQAWLAPRAVAELHPIGRDAEAGSQHAANRRAAGDKVLPDRPRPEAIGPFQLDWGEARLAPATRVDIDSPDEASPGVGSGGPGGTSQDGANGLMTGQSPSARSRLHLWNA